MMERDGPCSSGRYTNANPYDLPASTRIPFVDRYEKEISKLSKAGHTLA